MDRQSELKTYYSKYMTDVRGLSKSSVNHYLDALNNISRRLRDKGLVSENIYEIKDYEYLTQMRSILYADPDFIDLDTRGQRMYSAGLNNYIRFASGEDFSAINNRITDFDIPVAPSEATNIEQKVWKRSSILRSQALAFANYTCEVNKDHQTFIAENTKRAYMESHHLIPISFQNYFNYSLDIYANIVCLCPTCHRQIHYGLTRDRQILLSMLYEKRMERLINSGILISYNDMVNLTNLH
jgi:5-methylcytosine-specific restriction protein A